MDNYGSPAFKRQIYCFDASSQTALRYPQEFDAEIRKKLGSCMSVPSPVRSPPRGAKLEFDPNEGWESGEEEKTPIYSIYSDRETINEEGEPSNVAQD